MSVRTSVIWIAVAVLLVGGSAWWISHRSKGGPVLQFASASIDRGHIVAKATATGTLSALVTVLVGSQVSGRILELHADWNSPVKKGEVLARIDPQLFQAAAEQARASVTIAEGNIAKAKAQSLDADRQMHRSESLAQNHIVTQADLDTARTTADIARATITGAEGSLEQAKAALHQAEVNLDYSSIISPVDGVVISRNVDVGQTVAASLAAPTIFTIAGDLRKMQVDTSVSEADVGKLEAGMTASFYVDAYPSDTFTGHIRQVRNAPQTSQNVVTYDAVIDVDNPDLKLKPGMTANVTFIFANRDDVVRIPNAALRFHAPPEMQPPPAPGADKAGSGKQSGHGDATASGGPSGKRSGRGAHDRKSVWVLRDGKPAELTLRIGVTDGTMSELIEGDLHEGDQVITDIIGGLPPAPPAGGMGGPPRAQRFL